MRWSRTTTIALSAALLAAGTTLLSHPASAVASGTVSGNVFRDYNLNGVKDTGTNTPASASATDVGVFGAVVRVYDANGAEVSPAVPVTTDAAGNYNVSVTNAATADVRVQVTPPPGTAYVAGPHGHGAGTIDSSSVQFVTLAPNAVVNVGLSMPGDFVDDHNGATSTPPVIMHTVQQAAISIGGSLTVSSRQPSLISAPYGARGFPIPFVTQASMADTGSVWGVAQLRKTYAFTSALFKRHARLGQLPVGAPQTYSRLGAIYRTTLGGSGPTVPWADIDTAGTDPREAAGYDIGATDTFDQWFHDIQGLSGVGKLGLGGMALTPDNRFLYVMNLADQRLYRITVVNPDGVPTAGAQTSFALPTLTAPAPGCAAQYIRPFGVSVGNGSLWVPLTCVGPNVADLHGYVFRFDLGTLQYDPQPAVDFPLNYPRLTTNFTDPADWQPWVADGVLPVSGVNVNGGRISGPQPMLSDVVFDSNGDMTIAIKDRTGDQGGNGAGDVTPNDNAVYSGFSGGDLLRACASTPGGPLALEANGSCGSRSALPAQRDNGEGPSGAPDVADHNYCTGIGTGTNNNGNLNARCGYGEFYADNITAVNFTHTEIGLGAVLQVPGYGENVPIMFDANNSPTRTEGYHFESNVNGATDDYGLPFADANGIPGGFGKAGGLGDIVALIAIAPIEIGNRVWLDTNKNGIQDPGETPLGGVTVNLYAANGTTLLKSVVTDPLGNYFFSGGPDPDPLNNPGSEAYGITDLVPGTDFVVKLDRALDYGAGGPLDGLTATQPLAGADRLPDSNGLRINATTIAATVHTGDPGVDDHTIDFGLAAPTYAVGDFVFIDTNRNGIQDPGEPPVRDVRVTLRDANGAPVTHPDTTPVAPVTTDANGHYVFDFLPPGVYTILFDQFPPGYQITTQQVPGPPGTDSNPDVSTGVTPTFTLGPLGVTLPNMRDPIPSDLISIAAAIDPTIDAGIRLIPSRPPGGGTPPPPHHGRPHGPGYPCQPGDPDVFCHPHGDPDDPGDHHRGHHKRHGDHVTPQPRLLPGCGCDDPRHPERCRHDRHRPVGDHRRQDCCFDPRQDRDNKHRRDCPRRPLDTCQVNSESTLDPRRANGC